MAILGVLAMLLALSGPVVALTAPPPCDDASMAKMGMADDGMAPCKPAARACAEPCLATGNCQSQCGSSTVPFLRVDPDGLTSPLLTMTLHMAVSQQPPGTDSPVDGPPPRL